MSVVLLQHEPNAVSFGNILPAVLSDPAQKLQPEATTLRRAPESSPPAHLLLSYSSVSTAYWYLGSACGKVRPGQDRPRQATAGQWHVTLSVRGVH
jgi:hypothetical protein